MEVVGQLDRFRRLVSSSDWLNESVVMGEGNESWLLSLTVGNINLIPSLNEEWVRTV